MGLEKLFSGEEINEIRQVFSYSNPNMVLGTAFHLNFFNRLGMFEEERRHFEVHCNRKIEELGLAIRFFKEQLRGRKLIELGPGPFTAWASDSFAHFQDFGISEYIGVDPLL